MSHQIDESVFRGAAGGQRVGAVSGLPAACALQREQRPTADQGAHRWDAWRKAGLSTPFQQWRS
jgi:hypothetical protein